MRYIFITVIHVAIRATWHFAIGDFFQIRENTSTLLSANSNFYNNLLKKIYKLSLYLLKVLIFIYHIDIREFQKF